MGKEWRGLGWILIALLAAVGAAEAHPTYTSQGPFVSPAPGAFIPGPTQVPGKEFTDDPDENDAFGLDDEQVLAWDGVGGIQDTFDFSGSRGDSLSDPQVDALAHDQDALFQSLIANTSALLLSVTGNGSILYEATGGMTGTWATPATISHHGVTDLDALEVWGEELADNANRYSLIGDPSGVSVWAYNSGANTSTSYIDRGDVATAIGLGEGLFSDLDAMLIYDQAGDGAFGAGDSIIFSIAPVGAFDGGEIWVWNFGSSATFLTHGGHTWDTAFDVQTTFGVADENVNALEAVSAVIPAPPALLLGVVGIGLVAAARRRRK